MKVLPQINRNEKIAAIVGAILSLPLALIGFIAGGTLLGGATAGILAFPGAFLGAALVLAFGALAGLCLYRILHYLLCLVKAPRRD